MFRQISTFMEWVSSGAAPQHLAGAVLKKGEVFRYPYSLYRTEIGEAPTILDVGAADGRSARAAFRLWPKATVHCFEPGESQLAQLNQQAAGNPRWIIHPVALGATNGTAEFFALDRFESSSLKPPREEMSRDWSIDFGQPKVHTVDLRRLDDVLPDIERVGVLKVDVQGAEKEMLTGAPATLAKTQYAVIECGFGEAYVGSSTFSDITSIMEDSGLILSNIINMVANTEGKLLQCDLVFKANRS